MPLFAVTPVLSRGSKKEWWCVSAPARPRWRESSWSSTWGDPGEDPGTVAHLISPCLPGREMGVGGGGRQKRMGILCRRRGRGGAAGRSVRVSPCWRRGRGGVPARYTGSPRRNAGNEKQGVWSVRDRGGGTSSPSPSAPPPVAISPRSSARGDPGEKPGTVAHRLHPGYGSPPATSRVQLLTRYHPGYSCSPDITTHCPRPVGAGEERRRRGWGGGCRQKDMGIFCRRRGRGVPEKYTATL